MKEEDILYENGNFWVRAAPVKGYEGYEVYESGITHSVRRVIIGYPGNEGLQKAVYYCDKLHLTTNKGDN